MKFLSPSRKPFLILGLVCVLVLALACAKSETKTAAPAPAPAPAKPAAPAAAPAPAKPLTQEEAILKYQEGKPLVPGGPDFYPRKLLQQKGYQLHVQYHQTKLPLWTKANYGGELRGSSAYNPATTFQTLKILSLARTIYSGMLLMIDMGRCSLVGREGKFDTCSGEYGRNYEIKIIPSIFERWEQPDPVTYVFHVRKGVVWPAVSTMKRTDRQVTAEDIAWFLGVTKQEGILKDNFNLVDKFEAVDRFTVRIKMLSPHTEFLRHMANTSMGIFSRECYEDKECFPAKNSSPGAFLFNEQKSVIRQSIYLEKNPEYYLKGLPYIDKMTGNLIADPAAQKAAFVTKQLDHLYNYSPLEMESTRKQVPDVWIHSSWVLAGNQVLRPQLKGPLADVRVRRAMALVMDHTSLWEATYGGHTTFPNLVSRDAFGAEFYYTLEQAGEWYQFNPAKAKKLLAEAGYPNGFETSILTANTLVGVPYDLLLFTQAQWKRHLNIEVKIQAVDGASWANATNASTWPDILYQQGWNTTYWADQDLALIQFVKGQRYNLQKIDDPKVEEIYLKERGELDPAKRAAMLWEFEQYELSQVYLFRLSVLTNFVTVQGYEMNGASHEVTWYGPFNSPSWLTMFDPAKAPQR